MLSKNITLRTKINFWDPNNFYNNADNEILGIKMSAKYPLKRGPKNKGP